MGGSWAAAAGQGALKGDSMNSEGVSLCNEKYVGFEQGPVRPPSESFSLLIRVTRNCPWNRCLFCPVYKDTSFSTRSLAHVLRDIEMIHGYVTRLEELTSTSGGHSPEGLRTITDSLKPAELPVFRTAFQWMFAGQMHSVFLQDANSLQAPVPDLIVILTELRRRFPAIRRITSYARAHTVARMSLSDLKGLREAGLDRLHLGLESGSDVVLERMRKGATKAMHIEAGKRAKEAGFEISEYVIPGLGGAALSETHALETADVLRQINPDFIRLRTLAVASNTPLFQCCQNGTFDKCSEIGVVEELRLLIENLNGISSVIKSDHVLNLFGELEGRLPQDQSRMLSLLENFLGLPLDEQMLFAVGRRLGLFAQFTDLKNERQRPLVEQAIRRQGITVDNFDQAIHSMVTRFI